MITFERKYFLKFNFSPMQINRYLNNALKDLKIAKESKQPEVKFTYSYNALIKGGITLLAKTAKVKARSVSGHHVKIIEKMSDILNDESVQSIGNTMRIKRNSDLYNGGIFISKKEAKDFCEFVGKVLFRIKHF